MLGIKRKREARRGEGVEEGDGGKVESREHRNWERGVEVKTRYETRHEEKIIPQKKVQI